MQGLEGGRGSRSDVLFSCWLGLSPSAIPSKFEIEGKEGLCSSDEFDLVETGDVLEARASWCGEDVYCEGRLCVATVGYGFARRGS